MRPAEAMDRAFELAELGPKHGPNPRVGCVILDPAGRLVGEGYHRGAGTPHAEAAALTHARQLGLSPAGATAYTTLEPCNHVGRTAPCSRALVEAGLARVVFALTDPNPAASGGAHYLASHGVELEGDVDARRGIVLNRAWVHAFATGRPYVTLKLASTMDGRLAAPDGSSQWITGPEARAHAHLRRSEADAILVGTGTFLADRPRLTARREDGSLYEHQPLRVVAGEREIGDAGYLQIPGHCPSHVLRVLADREVRHVLLEGGPTLAAAFARAALIDEVHLYMAPALLGGGAPSVGSLGIESVDQALRWRTRNVERVGNDVFVEVGR
ncbi:MAG: bifunctional diaminohydroxyphosphoribosylaminopyrimidine deaminase/5-amino-6-(5-phosphoribosylamino)uracil reductase RibD [Bifidobacteriaceae bacterium]|jgi:diaminohydroxyphosphoribosylaminopyrimidine deaminase/5-amino-6-(5-phosphoribosylamino)uracil reductase|nr:bifunctional diaminohydroxyphosphoribosylaminopyrimidine deaminase/5-amino-6-(5-phosphoribosylamino)uracil reductase RibD [Bifidobacteriaceae bacterium]